MAESDYPTPSLLEPQSRGGDTAEGGFSFQDHVILAHIPKWLAQEGFSAMIKEAIGDIESKFFVPGQGFVTNLIEVKNHTIEPAEFWKEIKRFQEIDAGSPNTYCCFTLIGAGASRELKPVLNSLRRIQNSQDFYEEHAAVKGNSIADYIQLIENRKHTKQDALFLIERVTVEIDWNTVKSEGEAIFKQILVDHLEEYGDLSGRVLDDIYNHLSTFIRKSRNRPISRRELETKLREKIPTNQIPVFQPILIYTATAPEDNSPHSSLRFDWARFSGGETREIAPAEQWEQLMEDLQRTRTWVESYRNTKRIKICGNCRLPASLAIGSVFSAVRGYTIEIDYRGEVWATDSHPTNETPAYPLAHRVSERRGDSLIVSISIHRNIVADIQANLAKLELLDAQLLDIRGEQPITSSAQANAVVRNIKSLLVQYLQATGSKIIHLFYAGPNPLGLFLGHRLDATAPIICYGWSGNRQYARTCQLFSRNT